MKNIQKYRLLVQLLCVPLFIVGIFTEFKITLFVVMVTAFFTGVYHCGWMCPYGTLQELTGKFGSKVGIKKRKMPRIIQKYLDYLRYIIFGIFMVFTIDMLFTILSFDPRVNTLFMLTGTTVTVGAIIVLTSFLFISLFFDRPFCNYLCLEGAKFGLISLLRPVTIKRYENSCVNCRKCDDVCPMQIEVSSVEHLHSPSCINCFECIDICPVKNTLVYGPVTVTPKLKKHYSHMIALAAIISSGFLFNSLASSNAIDSGQQLTINESVANHTHDGLNAQKAKHNKLQSELNEPSHQDISNSTEISTSTSSHNSVDVIGISDGTYSGVGLGFRGSMTVEVTVINESITKVEVVKHSDDYRWYNYAYKIVSNSIIKGQSVDVDTVSGATYSANGIINGAKAALESARN